MSEHTPEELRRKIAELDGWRMDEAWDSPMGTGLVAPKGDHVLDVPDWPGDVGAAMTLCVEIGAQRHEQVLVCPPEPPLETIACFMDGENEEISAHGASPAEALARLALAALEAQAVMND